MKSNLISKSESAEVLSQIAAQWKVELPKIKNLKISIETHNVLKKYCDKRGIKMYRFLENLILEKCKEKKDIYGEN